MGADRLRRSSLQACLVLQQCCNLLLLLLLPFLWPSQARYSIFIHRQQKPPLLILIRTYANPNPCRLMSHCNIMIEAVVRSHIETKTCNTWPSCGHVIALHLLFEGQLGRARQSDALSLQLRCPESIALRQRRRRCLYVPFGTAQRLQRLRQLLLQVSRNSKLCDSCCQSARLDSAGCGLAHPHMSPCNQGIRTNMMAW